jgi:ankyrin repeat protein
VAQVFKKVISNEREYAGENLGIVVNEPTGSEPSATGRIKADALGPLGRAAFDGDAESAARFLGDGSGPSQCDIEEGAGNGSSPFLLASMRNHFNVMDLLLDRGANINTTSKHGWTPLMLASKRVDVSAVKYLIEHGADVNHLSPDRWTALAEATNNGSKIIMKMLLEAGADPEIRAQSDWAPLMHAAYRGDLEAVNLLLEAGASVEEISARDETVMLLLAFLFYGQQQPQNLAHLKV